MDKKYSCSVCKKEFLDGEVVGYSSEDDVYHKIIRDLNRMPFDCCLRKAMDGPVFGTNKIYYKNRLYDLNDLSRLKNARHLKIRVNDSKTGDIIFGDLEGLVL